MFITLRYSAGLFALVLLGSVARGELPSPRLDRLLPLGTAAGSTVEVEILGADLDEANRLLFDHPGITARHLKDRKFAVSVAAEVPTGTYDAQLVGKYGVSNPRLFAVSRGWTELAEQPGNDDRSTAQLVPINAVVNAISKQGRESVFRFRAKKGQRLVAECFGQRLDSPIDTNLLLTDTEGKQLASNADHFGKDSLVEFVAPAEGDYFLTVNDLSFRGGLPYRLALTDQPHVENVFPRVIEVGKPTDLTVFGRNLGPKAQPSSWLINDLPLEAISERVTAPHELLQRGLFRFSSHPTAHSVLPTAATCTLHGFQHRGVPLVATDLPVTLEAEPNDDPRRPQKLPLPVALAGRFDRERDADWFAIEPLEDGSYAFEVYCERIAGRADPYLVVLDDKDNRLAELDDFGIRMNAFDGHLRDPQGTVNLRGKQKYRVLVQDRYRRGGATYQYVLSIRKATADFYPAVIHRQNPGPGGTTVFRGGAVYLDVIIHNKGGFNGPITFTAEGLPRGLHLAPTTINDERGVLVLWADRDAPEWVGPIRVLATGKNGDRTIQREVRPYTRVWNNLESSRPMREQIVAIAGQTAPFALMPAVPKVEIEAGKKIDLRIQCERLWPEFKGSINLLPLSFPNPMRMNTVTLAEGRTDATVTLEVQANARPGEYTIALTGQAQVPFARDSKAGSRSNTLVSLPSRPLTVRVVAGKK